MKGIQSTKLMCTSEPLYRDLEKTLASMKKKKPSENYDATKEGGVSGTVDLEKERGRLLHRTNAPAM